MKISLIYMAAGNSRRFGSMNKLLYELDGKPMYMHLLERLIRICRRHPGWEVIVVTQFQEIWNEIRRLQKEIQGVEKKGEGKEKAGIFPLHAVFSPDSAKGVSWTIRTGIEAAGQTKACVFFAADQPYLSEATAEGFLIEMETRMESGKGPALGCVCFGSEPGNPVWFSREYFPELMRLWGDQGGRRILRAHMEEAARFQAAEARELADVDTMPQEGMGEGLSGGKTVCNQKEK